MKPTIQAAGEAMPTTRRSFLSALPGLAAASALPAALVPASTKMTARERYEYHLAEMKKAAEEIDPMIGNWHVAGLRPDDRGCALLITAFRLTGRYEGDGRYESASPSWNGKHQLYDVKLMNYRTDDERVFHVSTAMESMFLVEPRFTTFIGRKVGGLV